MGTMSEGDLFNPPFQGQLQNDIGCFYRETEHISNEMAAFRVQGGVSLSDSVDV